MLKSLSISNYALINQLGIQPSNQLNTITGETGAGKSIMLGAMGLLLGKRAESKVLLDESKKCIVEGEFGIKQYQLNSFFDDNELDYSDETIIRREISTSGKSRAFINDTPVTLDVLKQLSIRLIDIHSQHDTLLLGDEENQIQIVDFYAQNQDFLISNKTKFAEYESIKNELIALKSNQAEQAKELDFNKFQLKELQEAGLSTNDDFEKLENELKLSENAEEIKTVLNQVLQADNESDSSVLTSIEDLKSYLKSVIGFSSDLEKLYDRLESISIELNDVFSEIEIQEQNVDFDAERIEEVRSKVDTINSLLHKHRVYSIDDLLSIQSDLEVKVQNVEQFDEQVLKLENQLQIKEQELSKLATELSNSRKAIFEKLKVNVEHVLKELGMPNSNFEIACTEKSFSVNGIDDIQILFSANKGVKPVSLKKVASGGEFSRLMFTIKYLLADKTSLPTIIFDEIDSGISGEIAIKMGKMMNKMAENHQVLTITHLPQVAALGDKHYFVYKAESEERTFSKIREIVEEERELEIAKMISGDNPSEVAFENARELLSLGA